MACLPFWAMSRPVVAKCVRMGYDTLGAFVQERDSLITHLLTRSLISHASNQHRAGKSVIHHVVPVESVSSPVRLD